MNGAHTNRREFLQRATTVVAPLVAAPLATGPAAVARASRYHAVLIDDRHPEARLFGSVLAAHGAAVHSVPDGDITSLWLSTIAPAWRRGPVAIAGLTRPPVLFCLEQLAWSQGLRVIFHDEHLVTSAQGMRTAWAEKVADIVTLHGATPDPRHAGPTSAGLAPAPTQDAQLLTSWIIASA
jgi:hypothetical protein